MEYKDQLKMQLLSKKFYEHIVPHNMRSSSVKSAAHHKKQDCLYHYANGYYFYRPLDSIVSDVRTGLLNKNGVND